MRIRKMLISYVKLDVVTTVCMVCTVKGHQDTIFSPSIDHIDYVTYMIYASSLPL